MSSAGFAGSHAPYLLAFPVADVVAALSDMAQALLRRPAGPTESMVMSDHALISIVDDDQSAREAVAGLVRSLGFVVAEFESAADFLNSDCLSRTACLIADVRMPVMTGPELYSHLKALGTPIPTVLVTAYADETTRARALKAGVRCYLAKPLKPGDLLACIHSAIGDGKARIE